MKKIIILFSFALIILLQSTKLYSQEETGMFYFLIGTEGNEKAIMYLNILDNGFISGRYYTPNKDFIMSGKMEGSSIDINLTKLEKAHIPDEKTIEKSTIKAKFDKNNITLEGKHGSKKVSLSLAKTKINSSKIIFTMFGNYNYVFNNELDSNNPTIGEITYLDDNIICFYSSGTGSLEGFITAETYSLINYKKIEVTNVFNDLLLEKLPKTVLDYPTLHIKETFYEAGLYITPNRVITLYIETLLRGTEEDYDNLTKEETEYTFEELKPFVKKGSALEYLVN